MNLLQFKINIYYNIIDESHMTYNINYTPFGSLPWYNVRMFILRRRQYNQWIPFVFIDPVVFL